MPDGAGSHPVVLYCHSHGGDYASDARIDPDQIVTLGVSIGAALAMWVAVLDSRVCGCVQLCMLANIAPLIALGAHNRHGPYLTVLGLLSKTDIGHIAGKIARRPQFIGLCAK